MFWTGLIIGLFIGANIGIVVLSLLFASKKGSSGCQSSTSNFSKLRDAVCTVVTIDACLPNETDSR